MSKTIQMPYQEYEELQNKINTLTELNTELEQEKSITYEEYFLKTKERFDAELYQATKRDRDRFLLDFDKVNKDCMKRIRESCLPLEQEIERLKSELNKKIPSKKWWNF